LGGSAAPLLLLLLLPCCEEVALAGEAMEAADRTASRCKHCSCWVQHANGNRARGFSGSIKFYVRTRLLSEVW
jgi:hypothetical protein